MCYYELQLAIDIMSKQELAGCAGLCVWCDVIMLAAAVY